MESQDIKPRVPQDEHIVENIELNIWEALIPVFALVGMLAYNIYVYGDDALSGSNQFILLLGASVAAIVGFFNKVSYKQMLEEVAGPDAEGRALLNKAAERFGLSARGYHRVLRVARTIADLDGAEGVLRPHIAEALSFRLSSVAQDA